MVGEEKHSKPYPLITDPERALLVKLIIAEGGGSGGGGGGFQQVYTFAGNPNGNVLVNTTKPCVCVDTLNDVEWWKVDGIISNTGWLGP